MIYLYDIYIYIYIYKYIIYIYIYDIYVYIYIIYIFTALYYFVRIISTKGKTYSSIHRYMECGCRSDCY